MKQGNQLLVGSPAVFHRRSVPGTRPALLLAGYSFACCFGACCPPAGAEAGTGAFPGRMECQGIPSIVEISTLPDSTKPLMSVSRASAFWNG